MILSSGVVAAVIKSRIRGESDREMRATDGGFYSTLNKCLCMALLHLFCSIPRVQNALFFWWEKETGSSSAKKKKKSQGGPEKFFPRSNEKK